MSLEPNKLSECSVRFRCYWKALEEAKDGRCNMELIAGSKELDKAKVRCNLVGVGAWRAYVHWVD